MEKNQEKLLLDNTIKLLRRAKFEINGDEAIVIYQCLNYLATRLKEIDTPLVVKEPPSSIKEEPKPTKKVK